MKPIEITVPRLMKGAGAVTLWPFILYRRGSRDSIPLRCHEYYHWRQALRWGVVPWYLWYLILKVFYRGKPADWHPLEAPAYAKERQIRIMLKDGESINEHLAELGIL